MGKQETFFYTVDHSVIAKKTGYTIDPSWLEPDQLLSVIDKEQYFENMIEKYILFRRSCAFRVS